ncbi:MAG TPA: AMP-binding protein, partial [Thermoanaerobaculia bacterium]|nr:AMP-binding protein [Thermoanaerobaculia bacterium]
FWAPLAAGAALVMARPGGHRDPAYLVRTIAEHGVTVLQAVPSLLLAIFEEEDVGRCRTLRRICAGGEALTPEVMGAFFAGPLAAQAELVNLYGPTETAVEVTFWRAEPERAERPALLGAPIANARVHGLGRRGELLPVGVPGELCVGGPPVGRGYLGRPEETAARFVPDPWGEPGARLYRTGDLGRLRPDGRFESLGRIDHQVKIRGLRIEPGEIEAALAELPGVRQAVVLVAGERLAAFVVPRGEAPDPAALRAALAERLPAHMIPMDWAFPEALPWTPNGKVDRKALARQVPRAGGLAEEGSAPRTPEEAVLAGIFTRLLGVERVPVTASFFELGGHSLLAIRLAARVCQRLGVELSLRDVFEEPTVAGLARRIESLRAGASAAVPLGREGRIPLSFAQQRLWFLAELQPGSALYNMPSVLRVRGLLDVRALAAAFGEIVHRHEVLRTVYRVTDGEPEQVILPFAPLPLPVADLSGLPEEAARSEGERIASAWGSRPFDLESGPVLRTLLTRFGEEEHQLLLTVHHIGSDGWSSAILSQELEILYETAVAERPSPLPPLPLQYADYAIWQRRWLSGPVLAEQIAFWRERLAALPEPLELPADRPRPATLSGRGAYAVRSFPAPLAGALDRFARAAGATPFMASLAAFGALLGRYSGQDDLVVGAPVANRGRLDVEGLIGCFVNVLSLRIDLSGDPGAGELLAEVRDTALAAYSHQDVPFEKLVEELVPDRDLSRPPIFQVTFGYQEGSGLRPSLGPGLTVEEVEIHTGTSKFDLSLQGVRTADGLALYAEYATDLFEAVTVERLLGGFGVLLSGIAERPDARLSSLPLLAPGEREQLLAWNRETRDLVPAPPDATLSRLFAAQAERSPGAAAVVEGDESLTYAELALRVRQLAARLRSLGAGPEVRVGVCLERSAGLLVSCLAILEAGGVYVPLDPAYPAERLAFMVEDAGCAALIVQGEAPDGLAGTGVPLLRLDAPSEAPAAVPAVAGPDAGNLAYVIYTSGSTGRPKGVGVAHRDAAAHCLAVIRLFELAPGDRVLLFVSPSFDVAIEEMLPPLLAGATVVVRGSELWDTADLGERISRLGLTVVNFPTAYWNSWVRDAAALTAAPSGLRLMVIGGEAMPAESARLWHESPLGTVRLFNGYGPTETVVTPTFFEVERGAWGSAAFAPIGRPLPGRSAWVLDKSGNPLPAGVPGELFLGGVLARGYLG